MNIKEVTPKPVERVFEIRCSGSELELIYSALTHCYNDLALSMRKERVEDLIISIRGVNNATPL